MPEFLDLHGQTTKSLRALSEAAMQRHGLHLGQNLLLAALWEEDGSTPGEIAASVGVSRPTVVKMANRMSAAGLISRRSDPEDGRLVRLWLTDAGRALQGPVEAERARIERQVTAGLTAAERRQLIAALGKVREAARSMLADADS
ncbi:MAG TPA: MarR family transcriptional regulator [Solirubrobacterales bacterium]|jgi:DNA-binding MarR family transcriptional regulator